MSDLDQKVAQLEEELRELKTQNQESQNRKSTQRLDSTKFTLVLLSVIFGVGGLVFYSLSADFEGRLQIRGSPWGAVDDGLAKCRSGGAGYPQYLGASFTTTSGMHVQVAEQDADETTVSLWKDNIKDKIVLRKSDCSVFDVENRLAHVRVNNVETMSGHAYIECPLPNEGRVSFKAKYDQCYH